MVVHFVGLFYVGVCCVGALQHIVHILLATRPHAAPPPPPRDSEIMRPNKNVCPLNSFFFTVLTRLIY